MLLLEIALKMQIDLGRIDILTLLSVGIRERGTHSSIYLGHFFGLISVVSRSSVNRFHTYFVKFTSNYLKGFDSICTWYCI